MITKELKSTAIAQLKCRVSPDQVALNLDVPLPLVREWFDTISEDDLTGLKANVHAVQSLANGTDVIGNSAQNEELLKTKIEQIAGEIVDQVGLTVTTGDVVRAKTLQLCADTVTKLYSTIVNKDKAPQGDVRPNGQTISAFKSIMKD